LRNLLVVVGQLIGRRNRRSMVEIVVAGQASKILDRRILRHLL
jgi:hypothetical protein